MTTVRIRPVTQDDVERLVELAIAAWAPVFESFERILGREIYSNIWPDWRAGQRAGVEMVCRDSDRYAVRVAECDGNAVGFVAYEVRAGEKVGETQLLAVHPDYQKRGIGTSLCVFALEEMAQRGMTMAKVETGGDDAHAPARRAYERAGYTALPVVRYFKEL